MSNSILIQSAKKTAKCWIINKTHKISYDLLPYNTQGLLHGITMCLCQEDVPPQIYFPEISMHTKLFLKEFQYLIINKCVINKIPIVGIDNVIARLNTGIKSSHLSEPPSNFKTIFGYAQQLLEEIEVCFNCQNIYSLLVQDAPERPISREKKNSLRSLSSKIRDYNLFKQNPYTGSSCTVLKVLDNYAKIYNVPLDQRCLGSLVVNLRKHYEEDGHTCYPLNLLIKEVLYQTGHEDMKDSSVLMPCIKSSNKDVELVEMDDGKEYIYLKSVFNKEKYVANKLLELKRSLAYAFDRNTVLDLISAYEDKHGLSMSDKQKEGVVLVFVDADVSIITGCPGTGKSMITACIKYVFDALITDDNDSVIFAAPTGIAATRLNKGKGMTVHRALKVMKDSQGFFFSYNEKNPFSAKLIIIDETSMLDLELAYAVLKAIKVGHTKVVFIGDHNQLPSVGAGDILRHMIESQTLPVTKLTKIYRQTTNNGLHHPIIQLAKRITKGQVPTSDLLNNNIVRHFPLKNAENIYKQMYQLYNALKGNCQIIFPTKKTSTVGSIEGNRVIAANTRTSATIDDLTKFLIGDKVVCIKNTTALDANGDVAHELSSFNGDIGIVERCDNKNVLFRTITDRLLTVSYDNIDHGWCVTCNKAQGSEYENVILVLHESQGRMLNRELLYTAVTRAKKRLFIIGSSECLRKAVQTNAPRRYSLLSSLLQE